MRILVTGGLGYIGSHTIVKLLEKNFEVICIDNLVNSNIEVKNNIEKITNKSFKYHEIDLRNKDSIQEIISEYDRIDAVIHFAAFIYVPESINFPFKYYENNIVSLLNIIEIAVHFRSDFIFSSSSTVYGEPELFPLTEDMPLGKSLSPYGNSKKMSEEILQDLAIANDVKVTSLRYFNPAGAHESYLIGEKSVGEPVHLLPYITQTALGIRQKLTIFGNDYDTYDGTCIRDYIHVDDVAEAHLMSIFFMKEKPLSYYPFNIGLGKGVSVLEMIREFERSVKIKIPYIIGERRKGDVAELWSQCDKANSLLKWKPKNTLHDIIISSWEWEKKNS